MPALAQASIIEGFDAPGGGGEGCSFLPIWRRLRHERVLSCTLFGGLISRRVESAKTASSSSTG
eukprot:scaffold23254_cov57-Phaeocystis_antarctica.AAC.2